MGRGPTGLAGACHAGMKTTRLKTQTIVDPNRERDKWTEAVPGRRKHQKSAVSPVSNAKRRPPLLRCKYWHSDFDRVPWSVDRSVNITTSLPREQHLSTLHAGKRFPVSTFPRRRLRTCSSDNPDRTRRGALAARDSRPARLSSSALSRTPSLLVSLRRKLVFRSEDHTSELQARR